MKTFKIAIAGGGSTYTPGIAKALMLKREEFPVSEIRLYDINEERQNQVALITEKVVNEFDSNVKIAATTDPEKAFSGADFIFAQLRVGGNVMREKDEKIPFSHGIVGQETCGPGGMAYGLRTITPMIELCDFAEQYAPSAWIINYSNPAAIVAEALRKMRPNAQILNICDMPIGMMLRMAEILGCEKDEIEVDYFGLNHFGWFTDVYVKGESRMKELREYMSEHGLVTPEQSKDLQHSDADWIKAHRNVAKMLQLFPQYLPSSYLQYYLIPQTVVDQTDPAYTRANRVMDNREKNLFDSIKHLEQTGEFMEGFNVGVHGTFIVDVAMSLAFDRRERFLLIVENNGAIPNLPADAMVEIPAYVTSRGPEPIRMESIELFYKGLIEQQLASEKLLVEAALEGSYQKALQAFSLNKTFPSAEVAKTVLDELIEANKDYWPALA
ncbi:6-phospho-beta-glucosidase/maltose-6'-phosphate glucosidase [Bacillus pakistanensis]|uniref:6-phospho-beta-glucosidase/maltose-6'-phosphate glucosidase n=1 Tax=Rossellomorea pakistanensis TaxID=992288 RepID=A0ABS2NBU9_9BACI|nr:6-phospho-alpha-glucosidase [Bacillus pakistanensis]MBM7585337.1 6-phospho-beta-glucosidase/maltose-6'-phosphate glucosidase [Bacillus pakistanensis]